MLQGRLPSNKIVEMLAGGEPIDGREAHRLGLVNQLIDAADFDAGVAAFAATFARMSRPVLQLMMRVLKGASGQTLQSGHDAAARIYIDELMPLDDVEEGLAAFAEKRSPIWKHG